MNYNSGTQRGVVSLGGITVMELCEERKIFLLYNKSYEELNNSGIFVELELWNSLENYIFKKNLELEFKNFLKNEMFCNLLVELQLWSSLKT